MTDPGDGSSHDSGSFASGGYPRPWGDYVLLERLGVGGMSEVDLARKRSGDDAFVRFTVIKRIKADKTADESFVRMFKDEARITSQLHHAKIGTVYDFGRVGDEWFLALEYVPGIDLRELVVSLRERGQRVPVRVALRVVVDVLEALDYAHAKKDTFGVRMGIVHRDVNPRNVMVSIRGEVKLIDFGVAKATDRLERTETDHVKGKLAYMAPEQISGSAIDHRADLYAAGLVLHELLSGVSPFHGLNQVQILHRMMSAKPPPMPALSEVPDPAPLAAIVNRALAHAPDDRYPSAGAMAEDLRAFASTLGGLPSNDQLAAFLAGVHPELTPRLQAKMEAYARVDTLAGAGGLVAASLPPTPDASGTLGRATDAESLTATRLGVVGGSLVLVSVVSAFSAALVVALLLLGGYVLLRPAPAPAEPAPAVVAPVPAPPPPPGPPPAPPSTPAPVAGAPASPPTAPTGTARPPPSRPAPAPEVEPAPDPVPEVVSPLPPPPEPPPPPPPPAPAETGLLSVVSDPKGAPVRVDGVEVGRTPLERHRIPVGAHTIEVPGLTCAPRSVTIRKSVVTSVLCK